MSSQLDMFAPKPKAAVAQDESAGGSAFRGAPLPSWATSEWFSADDKKQNEKPVKSEWKPRTKYIVQPTTCAL